MLRSDASLNHPSSFFKFYRFYFKYLLNSYLHVHIHHSCPSSYSLSSGIDKDSLIVVTANCLTSSILCSAAKGSAQNLIEALKCHFGGKPQLCIPEKSAYPLLNLYPALLSLCHHAILRSGLNRVLKWAPSCLCLECSLAIGLTTCGHSFRVQLKYHPLTDVIPKFPV